jgi:glycosyltransferase involved in cell wall biosynthesis
VNCKKVTHLTSAHPRFDTRIFIKMCSSLVTQDYAVSLVVADGLGEQVKNGVSIFDVGAKSGGRLSRMTKTVRRVYDKAIELDSDVYHLHDPELMPIGLKLKKRGKKVIFDAHEDLPRQILGKPYLSLVAKIFLSKTFDLYERWACPKFDVIIAATPFIRDKFLSINPNSVDINNFPLLDELTNTSEWSQKEDEVVYVGSIAKARGIEQIIQAMALTQNVRLNLAGKFNEKIVEEAVKKYPAWSKVNELGFLSRREVNAVLAKSKVGLVTLHPIINYIDALPVKMFEYMAAGIPVIASDFPLWSEIIEGNQCGICVDPLKTQDVAEAIRYLMSHASDAEKMGKNGRCAVSEKYNWAIEEKKLFELYKGLLA